MKLKREIKTRESFAMQYISTAIETHLYSHNDIDEMIVYNEDIFGVVDEINKALHEVLATPNMGRRAIVLEGNFERFYEEEV